MIDQNNLIGLMPNTVTGKPWDPWYERFPDRFAEERKQLEAVGFSLDQEALEEKKLVSFQGRLAKFADRNLILTFPRGYPSFPPKVTDDRNCPLLPRHQKADTRSYCIFGPEGKGWYARLSAVDALNATESLIQDTLEHSRKNAIADDPLPEPHSAQPILFERKTILVPPGISNHLPEETSRVHTGSFRLVFDSANTSVQNHRDLFKDRGVVIQIKFSGDSKPIDCLPGYRRLINGKDQKGKVVFLPSLSAPIYDGKDLERVLAQTGIPLTSSYRWHAIIFPEESGDRKSTRFAWLVFHLPKRGSLSPVRTMTYQSSERKARLPGLGWLQEKRIGIVGCGALGSKIAASLAASGVEKFLLIDRDIMEPENVVRHEAGVPFFGVPKVEALRQRLLSLNPNSMSDGLIEAAIADPAGFGDFSDIDRIHNSLASCDLVINATGHQGMSRYLNEICYHLGIPNLHASVTNGAWSGEIVRVIPEKTPCWLCWNARFGDHPPVGEPAPEIGVYGPGCDQPTFTGTTHELGIVANLATSSAIDTLRTSLGTPSDFNGDYLLWNGQSKASSPVLEAEQKHIPWRGKTPPNGCTLCVISQ